MRVLIVGSGGREHALAWKVAQSARLSRLYIAPGNAGTSQLGENIPILSNDVPGLVSLANERNIDLVIVGPEASLAAGLADAMSDTDRKVFGPSRAAAYIESSKAFSKAFMARHNIPTARFAVFSDLPGAREYLRAVDYPVVIKASGLAAGKGVILPESIQEAEQALGKIMLQREFGDAGDQVVIEERLDGKEVSLLAFTDGVTVEPMPTAQDHKRLMDGDRGPNTGGMGGYAPVPCEICPSELTEQLIRTALQSAVDGLREEEMPFVGVLYAGLMLTADGPRVLEFNCRFGDPETQVLLPLLESDLLEIALACAEGRLAQTEVRWRPGAAACVTLASQGYPGNYSSGYDILGLDSVSDDALVFHAGTRIADGRVVTAGGRVLNVAGVASSLPDALACAYNAVERISFQGMQYRHDIGMRALHTLREIA
jgi:phosphoribosylamine---glycine ligase